MTTVKTIYQDQFGLKPALLRSLVMSFGNENDHAVGVASRTKGRVGSMHDDLTSDSSRMDFRHASSHLSQKRPGFYLILLRNELRHRTLREKPAIVR